MEKLWNKCPRRIIPAAWELAAPTSAASSASRQGRSRHSPSDPSTAQREATNG